MVPDADGGAVPRRRAEACAADACNGSPLDADFALKIGLVNEVVAPELLDETINALAAEIASKSTYTLALGKQAFYRQLQMPVSDAYEYAGELVVRNMAHTDAQEHGSGVPGAGVPGRGAGDRSRSSSHTG